MPGSRVIITGGSSGIGLAVAIELARQGAKAIALIARDPIKLQEAIEHIKKSGGGNCQVFAITADVSSKVPVQNACEDAIIKMGGLDAVICSAGISLPQLFIATSELEFERLMQVNYTGCVYVLKSCVPHLIRGGGGRIMLISSMAGLSGVSGFSAYSASKFALRGLAESLHMELSQTYGIYVSLCNPPDVNTPMLHRENENKPKECKLIAEGSGLFEADYIARDILNALRHWRFLVNTGLNGRLLALICSGTSPAHSGVIGLCELLLSGLLRVVSTVYRWHYNSIVMRVHLERVSGKLDDDGAKAHAKTFKGKTL